MKHPFSDAKHWFGAGFNPLFIGSMNEARYAAWRNFETIARFNPLFIGSMNEAIKNVRHASGMRQVSIPFSSGQ
jgi:hypothetical protein